MGTENRMHRALDSRTPLSELTEIYNHYTSASKVVGAFGVACALGGFMVGGWAAVVVTPVCAVLFGKSLLDTYQASIVDEEIKYRRTLVPVSHS